MNRTLQNLELVREIGERLRDLSSSRGTPSTQKNELCKESGSLLWAYDRLSKILVVEYFIVVGPNEILHQINERSNDDLLIIEVNKINRERILDQYTEVGMCSHNSSWLCCKKYYISDDCDKDGTHAFLFDCVILKKWLSRRDFYARSVIRKWVNNMIDSISDKNKPSI